MKKDRGVFRIILAGLRFVPIEWLDHRNPRRQGSLKASRMPTDFLTGFY